MVIIKVDWILLISTIAVMMDCFQMFILPGSKYLMAADFLSSK